MIGLCGSPPRTSPSARSCWLNFVSEKDKTTHVCAAKPNVRLGGTGGSCSIACLRRRRYQRKTRQRRHQKAPIGLYRSPGSPEGNRKAKGSQDRLLEKPGNKKDKESKHKSKQG